MRVTLIHNPKAGDDTRPERKELIELVESVGHSVSYVSRRDKDWADALDERADLIAIAGGDGTVVKVARKMLGRRVPLAVLPAGTANNIARSIGIADMPFDQLVAGWASAQPVSFDAGLAKGPWGSRHFIEGLGIGLFASIMAKPAVNRKLKRIDDTDEKIDRVLELLADEAHDAPAMPISATLDGEDISGRYILFAVMNMPFVGPNLHLAPSGQPGDGKFDVVLVTEDEREALREYLSCGQECKLQPPRLPSHSGRRVTIEWTGFELHIDDWAWPKGRDVAAASNSIDVKIESNCLQFLVPA